MWWEIVKKYYSRDYIGFFFIFTLNCTTLNYTPSTPLYFTFKDARVNPFCNHLNEFFFLLVNPFYHQRTEHIHIRHRFIFNVVNDGVVTVRYVPTADMLANGLTNTFPVILTSVIVLTSVSASTPHPILHPLSSYIYFEEGIVGLCLWVSTLLAEVCRFGFVVGIAGVSTSLGKFVGWIYGWHCWRKFVAGSSVWVVGQNLKRLETLSLVVMIDACPECGAGANYLQHDD